MHDRNWSAHTTEFDIVEEGKVHQLMSLPERRNLGFQFELSPIGIWKHQLGMSNALTYSLTSKILLGTGVQKNLRHLKIQISFLSKST